MGNMDADTLARNAIRIPIDNVIEDSDRIVPWGAEPVQRRLLERRQEVTQATAKLEQAQHDVDAIGEPRQRADRNVRTQLIMTIRTLLLDNALSAFLTTLIAPMRLRT